jgi:uncharacterized oxidoreductase
MTTPLDLKSSTVLITGGASGIGLALAKRFVAQGAQVIVCGRRKEQLALAKSECPQLVTLVADVSSVAERQALAERVVKDFPKLNVLINNAGIQNRPPPLTAPQNWADHEREVEINLKAPMHLSMLLIPHLVKQSSAAIMNVSSGLAFSPLAFMGTYCLTKAALHSFTLSLRHQLKQTSVQVVEIIPPMVQTDLGGKGLHDEGAPLDVFADHSMAELAKGSVEFGFGFSEKSRTASRAELDGMFAGMNR